MQYKVPQDVQREDTIIGPITLRQMGILLAGGGIAYTIYISLAKAYFIEIWLPPVAIISALTLAFAFLKIHSLPFHTFLMNWIEYKLLPHKRFWIQGGADPFIPPFEDSKKAVEIIQKTESKEKKLRTLDELTKIVDTHGKIIQN